jgi:calmodulin
MTDFTAEEKERLKKLFDRIDADKDGKIKAADFKKLAAEFGRDMTDERANELVKKADPSNSGFIDFKNFCSTLYVALPKIKAVLMAIALFREIDTDNSGTISKAELKKLVVEAGASVPDSKLDELIAKVDTTGTGQINFRDFIVALAAYVKANAQ